MLRSDDGLRSNDGERPTGRGVGDDDVRAGVGGQHAVGDRAGHEVDADQVGHVARPRVRGDVRERPSWTTVRLDDHHPIGQRVGVDGIVGDQHAIRRTPRWRRSSRRTSRGYRRPARRTARRAAAATARSPAHGRGRRAAPGRPTARPGGRPAIVEAHPRAIERAARASAFGDTAGPQPERDVLQRRQMREQQVVLEHDARRRCSGRHEHPAADRRARCRRGRSGRRRSAAARRGNAAAWSCRRRSVRARDVSPGATVELDVAGRRRRGAATISRVERSRRRPPARASGRAARPARRTTRDQHEAEHDRLVGVGLERQVTASGIVCVGRGSCRRT